MQVSNIEVAVSAEIIHNAAAEAVLGTVTVVRFTELQVIGGGTGTPQW